MIDSSNAFTKISDLLDFLNLPHDARYDISPEFPMRIPREFAEKMEKGNPNDPLFLQTIPTKEERARAPGFSLDPVGDLKAVKTDGILQKYERRVLVEAFPACSVRCRFCFRRNETLLFQKNLPKALDDYLFQNEDIAEVIFSGGDPFMMPVSLFEDFLNTIDSHLSVKTIRIHTRVPLTETSRAENFISSLQKFSARFREVIVLHANHAQELEGKTKDVLLAYKKIGVTLLNQSVLLRNINDQTHLLVRLSEKLFDCGVLPYYLHLLDRAHGTAHFLVTDQKAKTLLLEMRKKLPGYLVPRLAREIEGEASKIIVA